MANRFGDGVYRLLLTAPLIVWGGFRRRWPEPDLLLTQRGWWLVRQFLWTGVRIRRAWDWLTDIEEWWAAARFIPESRWRIMLRQRIVLQGACAITALVASFQSSPTTVQPLLHGIAMQDWRRFF